MTCTSDAEKRLLAHVIFFENNASQTVVIQQRKIYSERGPVLYFLQLEPFENQHNTLLSELGIALEAPLELILSLQVI